MCEGAGGEVGLGIGHYLRVDVGLGGEVLTVGMMVGGAYRCEAFRVVVDAWGEVGWWG